MTKIKSVLYKIIFLQQNAAIAIRISETEIEDVLSKIVLNEMVSL